MNATNKILLRRKNLLIVEPINADYEQTKNEQALVVTMMKNVQSLGFTFSKELFEALSHMNRDELKVFYSDLIPALKELVGADVEYNPMYPNFPTQVAEMDGIELFINAIVHYWSFGTLMPEYEKDERLPLIDVNKMALLSTGNHEDLMEIFKNLVASKTSLSAQDKEDVTTIIKDCADYANYLPDEIPLKENVALIGKLIIEEAPVKSASAISKYFRTATDVLRLVTALSDGDISLAGKTKYRNLKRRERRMILDLLANCGNITEDLFRYQYEWIRVAEILHPFEYNYPRYKDVNKAFNTLRNDKKPLMFGGKVQAAILRKDMKAAADLLKSRPGEFARQLDKVLRDSDNPAYILECFKGVAVEISAPVLLQVRQHFIGRMAETPNPVRVFFPKGNLAKAMSIKNESYTRLRSGKMKAYHSGDITNGGSPKGKGVAEFLDVNIDAVAENGRYIVYQVYNYTGQHYSTLENCRFGWMEREDVDSGEIFEPTTVNMVMDVNAEGVTAIPVIFDCVERKFIWCDMNLGIERSHYGGINLESNLTGVTATCYAMTHLNKPNIYDLAMLNAMARGTVVDSRNEADIIFSNDTTIPFEVVIEKDEHTGEEKRVVKDKPEVPIITAYDLDYFMGQLL